MSHEYAKAAPTVAVALFVAVIAALQYRVSRKMAAISEQQAEVSRQQVEIAKSQAQVARAKVKLDLFEERYGLYLVIWRALSNFNVDISEEAMNYHVDLSNSVARARFLFGSEIGDLFAAARLKSIALAGAYRTARMYDSESPQRARSTAEVLDLDAWAAEQMKALPETFGPFLNFEEWR